MSYRRVLPRDLFNEAKLLKCLGQLALIVHDGIGVRWPLRLEHQHPELGFEIEQDPSSGNLFCDCLTLLVGWQEVRAIDLQLPYNSRQSWPLLWTVGEDCGAVFNDAGQLSSEFTGWLDRFMTRKENHED